MKELNEYKEEIFRRSAQKKRQLQKRRRIALSVGIPLCLCCVITAVVLSTPSMDKEAKMDQTRENVMSAEEEMPKKTMEFFSVTNAVDAAMVRDILEAEDPEYTINREEFSSEDTLADQAQLPEYSLTLQRPDGSMLSYLVQGRKVYCMTNGETLWLSDEQARTLYTFLTQIGKTEDAAEHSFMAKVLECGEGWALVEPLEGEPERNSCDQISFSTGKLEEIQITAGAKVEIIYDGQIMESCPAQIHAIGWKLVTS